MSFFKLRRYPLALASIILILNLIAHYINIPVLQAFSSEMQIWNT
jgi:hypothetical protein